MPMNQLVIMVCLSLAVLHPLNIMLMHRALIKLEIICRNLGDIA
jgi:hypothetical protein